MCLRKDLGRGGHFLVDPDHHVCQQGFDRAPPRIRYYLREAPKCWSDVPIGQVQRSADSCYRMHQLEEMTRLGSDRRERVGDSRSSPGAVPSMAPCAGTGQEPNSAAPVHARQIAPADFRERPHAHTFCSTYYGVLLEPGRRTEATGAEFLS